MNFFLSCLKGIAIGAGAILPGISSGVLCVILGIYEKLLDSFLNFFHDVKKNLTFLFPILLGGGIGVLLFSHFLNYFLTSFPLQTKSIFIGLILASIPSLGKEVYKKVPFKYSYLLFTLISFGIGLLSVYLENVVTTTNSITSFSFFYLFLCGFVMSIGIVIPGVSSTILLMLMGVYSTYLFSLSCAYMPVLLPMGIGLLLGSFFFMKITKFLLDHFYAQTFSSIIGFTLGSIFVLLPNISLDLTFPIFLLCVLLGISLFSLFRSPS